MFCSWASPACANRITRLASGNTKYVEIQTESSFSETNKKQNQKKRSGRGRGGCCVSSPSRMPPCIFCRGWAGGFALNYISRVQLSLSEDLPRRLGRFPRLKLSGPNHFLLFAFGTVGRKTLRSWITRLRPHCVRKTRAVGSEPARLEGEKEGQGGAL